MTATRIGPSAVMGFTAVSQLFMVPTIVVRAEDRLCGLTHLEALRNDDVPSAHRPVVPSRPGRSTSRSGLSQVAHQSLRCTSPLGEAVFLQGVPLDCPSAHKGTM